MAVLVCEGSHGRAPGFAGQSRVRPGSRLIRRPAMAHPHFPDPVADLDDDLRRPVRPRWRAGGAAAWSVAGATAGGAAWGAGVVAARYFFGAAFLDPAEGVLNLALVLAVMGAGWGAVVGGVSGLARRPDAAGLSAGR